MSVSINDKQTGFVYEITYGVDPIVVGSEIIEYGNYTITFGDFPAVSPTTVPYHLPNQSREPNEFKIAKMDAEFPVLAQAVNGIPFYLMLGKSVTSGAVGERIHAITAQAVGTEKPSFTHRYVWKSSLKEQFKHINGCKLTSLTLEFNVLGERVPQLVLLIKGLQFVVPAFAGDTTSPPVNPGDGKVFNKIPMLVRWDSTDPTSGGEDISDPMANIAIQLMDSGIAQPPTIGNIYNRHIIDGDFDYIVKFATHRGFTKTMITYQQEFTNSTTPVNMAVRIPRANGEYLECVLRGLTPKAPIKKENKEKDIELDIYEFWVTSVTVNSKDPLDETIYYGE